MVDRIRAHARRRLTVPLAALALAVPLVAAPAAEADYDVSITYAPSSNGSFSGGGTKFWTPSGSGSNVNMIDLLAALSTSGVVITTAGGGAEPGDISLPVNVVSPDGVSLTFAPGGEVLIGAEAISVGGGLRFSGPVSLGADATLQASAGSVNVASVDSAAGGPPRDLIVNSGGPINLQGDVGSVRPLASLRTDGADRTSLRGSITTSGPDGVSLMDTLQVESDVTITAVAPGSVSIPSPVVLSDPHLPFVSDLTIHGAGTLGGSISGDGNLTKSGTGTLVASTPSPEMTGTTTVSGGTLQVTGSLASIALPFSGGTLAGTGTTGTVTGTGGTVSPGASPGILHTAGLDLGAPATGSFELDGLAPGSGYDQLDVDGAVSLEGAELNVSLGFAPPADTSFLLIDNDMTDRIAGAFAGIPQGGKIKIGSTLLTADYSGGDGNDFVITTAASAPMLPPAQLLTPPAVSVAGARLKTAARSGSATAKARALRFVISLSRASAAPVSVRFRTRHGSARACCDYRSTRGTLRFDPGVTSLTVPVRVRPGPAGRRRLSMLLTEATNATISVNRATGKIIRG